MKGATLDRRAFLKTTAGAFIIPSLASSTRSAFAAGEIHIAPFRVDVSPPLGHSLCGGWIRPAEVIDDPLEARGVLLLGSGAPVVLCAVDWTGILNSAHVAWREAIAEGAGTTPDRVAVQCVHQHNAPFACTDAQEIVAAHSDIAPIVDLGFHREVVERVREAAAAAVRHARRVTHVAVGEALVDRVASNRRIVGAEGKVTDWRGSSSKDPRHHELPEGLIDPRLKTVAWFDGDRKVAVFHYYATHPMSFYGDGRVTSDFPGIARAHRDRQEPEAHRMYFTGSAGNIAAGKYNDGTPEARRALSERIEAGMARSELELRPRPIGKLSWRTVEIRPAVRESFTAALLEGEVADSTRSAAERGRAAYMLAWLRRSERGTPIVVSALCDEGLALLHLPGECFVEYQLRAQALASDRFVATAAYGDGGPWYIPTAGAYPQGGYEVSVAFCAPAIDATLDEAIRRVLA